MIRSYKFRMYPTSKQEDLFRAMLDDHRFLYNAALQERGDAWKRSHITIKSPKGRHLTSEGPAREVRVLRPDV